ncbi:MAG: hypothetical protein DWI03_02035 [Planctomycetota bacterium]|nr:MAG: hypothetical protein DWI03_02035 [Planctomycetota bacterium]
MSSPEAAPTLPAPCRILFPAAAMVACLTAAALPGCSTQSAGSAGTEPAKGVVVAFLEAIKKGDENTARGMLTRLARTKTEEMGISVAPPVRDSATYSVRACEMVSDTKDLVHVGTTWTDVDSDGFKTSENVVWVVRLDPEGWRVVGMAMRVFEDMPPLLLNFEDPEDMLAKQEMVAAELEKRAKQEAAAKPAGQRTARGEQAPVQRQ